MRCEVPDSMVDAVWELSRLRWWQRRRRRFLVDWIETRIGPAADYE